MNIPNALTLLRILLVPLFVGLVLYGHLSTALVVFLVAGLTDALDGLIARLLNQQTTLGRYLDPLADKLLLVAAFVVLSVGGFVPLWVTIIVVSRDIIISVGSLVLHLFREQPDIAPTLMGKATTVLQLVYILAVLAGTTMPLPGWVILVSLGGVSVLTVASGLHYLIRGVQILGAQQGVRA
ncbi:MAG: CDP-diacylglycerol--glycerol-3-phosphate 3-phosphatidyltransferase [Nitrospirota bacterium]